MTPPCIPGCFVFTFDHGCDKDSLIENGEKILDAFLVDIIGHPLDERLQLRLFLVGKTLHQQFVQLGAALKHHLAQLLALFGQHQLLEPCIVVYAVALHQALLLHQHQHAGSGGTGDAKFLFNILLVDVMRGVGGHKADDARIGAAELVGFLRDILADVTNHEVVETADAVTGLEDAHDVTLPSIEWRNNVVHETL